VLIDDNVSGGGTLFQPPNHRVYTEMATTESVTLRGRELQAILGVLTIYLHVPFTRTVKRVLTDREAEAAEALHASIEELRNSLVPHPVGQWTPPDRQELLSRTTVVHLSHEDASLVEEFLEAGLAEYGSDFSIGPFLIPGTKRHDLETALSRVAAIATNPGA
jgi:hypothetical protein